MPGYFVPHYFVSKNSVIDRKEMEIAGALPYDQYDRTDNDRSKKWYESE